MLSVKLTVLIVSFQTLLFNNAVSAIWMPDCSKAKHMKKAQCVCRNPSNWHLNVCQDWWHKPAIEASVEKMSRIVGGELAPRNAYPWFARLITRSGLWW